MARFILIPARSIKTRSADFWAKPSPFPQLPITFLHFIYKMGSIDALYGRRVAIVTGATVRIPRLVE